MDARDIFELMLDECWSAFRARMLEAYESTRPPEQELQERIAAMQEELSTLRETAGPASLSQALTLEPFCHPSLEAPLLLSVRPLTVDAEEPMPQITDSAEDARAYGPVEIDESEKLAVPGERTSQSSRGSRKSRARQRRSGLVVTPLSIQRVRMRLGHPPELISGAHLCSALHELGLRSYTEEDMNILVNQLSDYVDLKFFKEDDAKGRQSHGSINMLQLDVASVDLEHDHPEWCFPEEDPAKGDRKRRSWATDFDPKHAWNVCPTEALVEMFVDPVKDNARKIFGPKARKHFEAIREILMKWDPSDLVAELTKAKEANLDLSESSSTQSGRFDMLSSHEAQAIRQRLRVRLGVAVTSKRLVSGRALHSAMEALGLTSYAEENMNDLVNTIADFIDLRFEGQDKQTEFRRSNSPMAVFNFDDKEDEADKFGQPLWQWPARFFSDSHTLTQHQSMANSEKTHGNVEGNPQRKYNVVPLQALMDVFMVQDADVHRKIFGSKLHTQFEAMREILLAGDTNRLVAELTFVRINDLAAPPEKMGVLLFMEPFVAALIILNGVMIGFQTHPGFEAWDGWPVLEVIFVVALLLENVLRMRILGLRVFFCGNDKIFNWFDFFLSFSGLADVAVQAFGHVSSESADVPGVGLLRFCRLIRLVRVVKVFRLRCMKELRLMVKGLVAGFRTLLLSFVLLIAVLYVISGFATMTFGSDQRTIDVGLVVHFETIPQSMFTAFLCFAGECIDRSGRPIPSLMANEFGLPFVMGYVVSYMLVSMGIFNVILAVYVDITMKAAKENDAMTAEQHSRESIRIARTTRELLKKFAAAYRLYQDIENFEKMPQLDFNHGATPFTDNDIHAQIAITKELFLLVIQDRYVQSLMDDLDLPPDRANLFEAIDADGSGTLHVTELVQGLLQIRGEVKKSDAVATLLSTKALQNMVTEMREEISGSMENLRDVIKDDVQARLEVLVQAYAINNPRYRSAVLC
ncbi:unnamed protein product [Effrenium voratum]|nr:unnamed protein product [Effrenium voratum]